MIAQWVEVTQLPKEACVTDQCTHKPRESDLVALIQWTHQMILLCSPCLHLFFILCTLRFLPWLPPTAHIPARSLPSIPVLGVHLFLSIQAILSSDPEAYPGYLHKARGSFCHISEQENQFNKYLLSTYSVQGTVCILKRKMVWLWGGGKNKNRVQLIYKCLGQYREQGWLYKVLVQSDWYLDLFQNTNNDILKDMSFLWLAVWLLFQIPNKELHQGVFCAWAEWGFKTQGARRQREWSYNQVASSVEGNINRECCTVCISLPTFPPSLVPQRVKNLPAAQETRVWSPGWEDPLEKGMATHFRILAWRIPWMEEPGRL